jgi:hypothetical protein
MAWLGAWLSPTPCTCLLNCTCLLTRALKSAWSGSSGGRGLNFLSPGGIRLQVRGSDRAQAFEGILEIKRQGAELSSRAEGDDGRVESACPFIGSKSDVQTQWQAMVWIVSCLVCSRWWPSAVCMAP